MRLQCFLVCSALIFCNAANSQFCLEDGVVDENLNDPDFVRTQLNCVLYDDAKCDNFGHRLRAIAPDVLRGACFPPCTPCIRKQIHKVIIRLQTKYPREFGELINKYARKG